MLGVAAGRSTRLFALVSALAITVAGAAPLSAKDCGERPTGKNPTPAELNQAIEELSMAHEVPTEIIKAVAFRESGVQQWKSSGALVINEKDCGLGMMQLTGATAEQFDVERLKAEWRYNLEAGVTVLRTKWQRGIRTHWKDGTLPKPDPAILENWYYALSLYQGRRTGEYPGKVFDHLAKRPGPLKKLLPAAVEASFPDDAFTGFKYGDRYTALAGNKVIFEGGETRKVKTTKGTIGDPKLLEQLGEIVARAEKALAKGQIKKAVRYFELVLKTRPDAPQAERAKAALADLRKRAAEHLARGHKLRDGGDLAGALVAYDRCEDEFLGLAEADQAAEAANAIRTDPKLKAEAARLEAESKARFLLEKADRALAKGKTLEVVRVLRLVSSRYGGTAAATEAESRLQGLLADPQVQGEVEGQERARALREAVALAESYLANELFDKAIEKFQGVIELAGPDSSEAERARRGILEAEELRE
ncbi:MAG: hypothetical protein ACYS22_07360 [Planctomycetota bacterium]